MNNGKQLFAAASRDDLKSVKILLTKEGIDKEYIGDEKGNTPLLVASRYGHLAVVKELLAQNANKEAKNNSEDTPLLVASRNGHLAVVQELLAKNANKEATDKFQNTALYLASQGGHLDIVRTLLEGGVDKDAKNERDQTPLMLACEKDYIEIVKLLVETYNANINHQDRDGYTPSYLAVKEYNLDIIRYLKSQGADFTLPAKDGSTADSLLEAKNKELKGGEQSDVEINSPKPLSELTVVEVGRLLESIKFDEYKAVFVKNKIDGKCLMKCNTVEDAVNMGVTLFVKARVFLDEIKEWKAASHDRSAEIKLPIDAVLSAGDTLQVMSNGNLVKPLSDLSVHEVGIVLEALKIGKYKEAFISNEIDGECLMKCNTVQDVVNMGISIFVKAHVFLDKVMTWKTTGVPKEYFSFNEGALKLNKYKKMKIHVNKAIRDGCLAQALTSHSSEEVLILCVSTDIYCLHMVKEYQINLITHFPEVKSESNMNRKIKFILHGSGFDDAEVQLIVSLEAARKIYAVSHHLVIKEIQSPLFGMQDNDWASSMLSFEPSDVSFSNEDCLIVITPTLMTWRDNEQINEQELLDALTVASRDEESGIWSPCYYSDNTFHGIIGINEKDLDAKIFVAYVLEHFCDFRLAILALLLIASQVIGFRPINLYLPNVKVKKSDCIMSADKLSSVDLKGILNGVVDFVNNLPLDNKYLGMAKNLLQVAPIINDFKDKIQANKEQSKNLSKLINIAKADESLKQLLFSHSSEESVKKYQKSLTDISNFNSEINQWINCLQSKETSLEKGKQLEDEFQQCQQAVKEVGGLVKHLSKLSIPEVGRLLDSIKFDEFKAVFAEEKIDGNCLMTCNTSDEAKFDKYGMNFMKARVFLNKVMKWKASGVPMEYLSDIEGTNQDDL